MIKPEELRIGNWVRVGDIESTVDCLSISSIGLQGNLFTNYFKSVDPILLTPEILNKCGLEKVTGNEYNMFKIPPHYLIGIYEETVSFVISIDEVKHLVWHGLKPPYWKFKSLHQLQNLYFALTGEELIYKP